MFSGELVASKLTDVMYLISGKTCGVEEIMNRVPLAIYMLRYNVHPGAWDIIEVSGKWTRELIDVIDASMSSTG